MTTIYTMISVAFFLLMLGALALVQYLSRQHETLVSICLYATPVLGCLSFVFARIARNNDRSPAPPARRK